MDDYGKFCYLDVQKTGSTFVSKFLKDCSLTPALKSFKHGPIRGHGPADLFGLVPRAGFFRARTFYFNSVRNPFGSYASLYNYGCDRKGGLYMRLKTAGRQEFYDGSKQGFLGWLDYILDARNAGFLGEGYEAVAPAGIGFLTYRFLRLSVASPRRKLASVDSLQSAAELLKRENICTLTLKNETLTEDLAALVFEHLPGCFDLPKARDRLGGERVNASQAKAASRADFETASQSAILQDRERLLLERFY